MDQDPDLGAMKPAKGEEDPREGSLTDVRRTYKLESEENRNIWGRLMGARGKDSKSVNIAPAMKRPEVVDAYAVRGFQFTQATCHSQVHPPKVVLHRLVHYCKPRQDKEGHRRLCTELNICKLLEVYHRTLLGHHILSTPITTPLTTQIHARVLKVPATGSSTRYASCVDTTTRILSASIKHAFCVFSLVNFLFIFPLTVTLLLRLLHSFMFSYVQTGELILSTLGLSITYMFHSRIVGVMGCSSWL